MGSGGECCQFAPFRPPTSEEIPQRQYVNIRCWKSSALTNSTTACEACFTGLRIFPVRERLRAVPKQCMYK